MDRFVLSITGEGGGTVWYLETEDPTHLSAYIDLFYKAVGTSIDLRVYEGDGASQNYTEIGTVLPIIEKAVDQFEKGDFFL